MSRFYFDPNKPNNRDNLDSIQSSNSALVKDGFVVLDNVVPLELVRDLKTEFTENYNQFFEERNHQDALKVGNKRYMITVKMSGVFSDLLIYANPFVLPLIKAVLGEDLKLESFGVVLSLSGAKDQKIHRDAPLLFDNGIATILPAHAVTVVFPLVEMNETNGTTALWQGSHRWPTFENNPIVKNSVPTVPVIPEGSCAIWDFRLFHAGTENRSLINRPILYITYAKSWWQDPANFRDGRQSRILLGDNFMQSVPDNYRHLFSVTGAG
jgi:ectoine hydroxylase-related dioxygenase (phytanoyl-CoA dioxygenase family)